MADDPSDPEAPDPGAVVERVAARVLVLDGAGAVLLLHGVDPGDPGRGTWWFTPGGGLDPGESYEDAARRELFEETGLAVGELGPVVHTRTTCFPFEGVNYRQRERFFCTRTARFEPVDTGWSEIERRTVLGHRWWTAAELTATRETFYPEELPDVLSRLDAAEGG